MSEIELTTLESILNAGKKEFLEKGFKDASLRNIVKEAGVTTGAFYGYYKSKEELFDAFVKEPYEIFMNKYKQVQNEFANLPDNLQPDQMNQVSGDCMDWMVVFIYENFDAFELLVRCKEGTRYQSFIDELVEIEVTATYQFISVLQKLGRPVKNVDPQLEHILVSGLFTSFFETVIHKMPQQQAIEYIHQLRDFYSAGWAKIMGL